MKIKLFVSREIQYFELWIFSFNLYVYHLTRGFVASTRTFNLLTRAFHLPTRAFSLPTRAFNLATSAFSVLTRGFELITRGFELVTRNSCFTFPQTISIIHYVISKILMISLLLNRWLFNGSVSMWFITNNTIGILYIKNDLLLSKL